MAGFFAKQRLQSVAQADWVLPGVRPVTLLIASGIVLIAAIVSVTGFAAGQLREQALANSESELARLDAMLAVRNDEAIGRTDTIVKNLAEQLHRPSDIAGREAQNIPSEHEHGILANIANIARIDAILLIDASGQLVNSSNDWPIEPNNFAGSDYFAAFTADPKLEMFIGAPQATWKPGAVGIPLARRLVGPNGEFAGLAVAVMSLAEIEQGLFSVPLGGDAEISLLRRDGMLLARYPATAEIGHVLPDAVWSDAAASADGGVTRRLKPDDGRWTIEAIHPLHHYPLFVLMTRDGERALVGWSRQVLMVGLFALVGAILIVAMVVLIGRQFRIYATLTTVRAQNIEMERARLAAEAELLKKERLSVLGQLTATVAHELRNPLSAIRNTLFSIKEIASAKALNITRPAARMERSIERCDRIIGDLLEYTRQREPHLVAVNFDRWLDDVLTDQAIPGEVTMIRDFAAANAIVALDSDRMRRVVINLVDNAVQALTDPQANCPDKRVVVRTRVVGGAIELMIADSGPGISPANLPRIFEPLFSTKSFGTGLGLATVKQIVAQHDGTISIDSEPQQGARVSIELPLGREAKAAA
jgi:signal transduction histidine kinase